MIKVLCTVVFIMGSGQRQVTQLDGIVLKDSSGPNLLVDFGDAVPTGPQARWVKENDCLYYDDPSKVYGEPTYIAQLINESRQQLRRIFERPIR